MRRFAIIRGLVLFITAALAGCGGGGSSANNVVATVTVSPTSLSLNSGDVAQITATAQNSAKTNVSATFTFNSSNTSLVTVSSSGVVCAGVWDANFIVCNGKDASGNPLSGTANITVTAGGVTSSPTGVSVHPKVTSVMVDPVAGCTSSTQTLQFTAHACSSLATPHDSSGPCAPNAKEITSQVGSLAWTTVDTSVATVDTNGLVTAANPGVTGVVASASSVNSSAAPFRTCLPVRIRLHVVGDPPGSSTTSASMTQNQTLMLEADMDDENGVTKNSVTNVILSDLPAVASMSGTTLTASSFGGGGISAGCTPPACGNGINLPIYSNLFKVTVAGTSPATTVYATSSFTPPSGTSPTLVPIDTSTGTAGTAINLPGVPNSLVFAGSGSRAYLGTTAGLVTLDPAANAVSVVDPTISGKVLAVSPNGAKVIVSNAAKDPQGNVIQPVGPSQRLWVFDQSSNTTQTFVKPGAVAANIDTDGFRDYIVTNDGTGNIYVVSPALTLQTINIGGTSADVASLASNDFIYVANSAGLEVIGTCNNVQQPTANNPPTNSSTIQLVQPVANNEIIVAVDANGVDVETATVTPLTPPLVISAANCTPGITYSNQFLNFGIGPFTARQLLLASDGSRIVVLAVGNSNVLAAVPGATPSVATIPLAGGGTQALSGGMTPDGNTAWVGVAGTNTVDKLDLTMNTDTKQVATSFKKSDGSAAPPDIVAIRPK
jgi:hypothetical protein